MKKRFLVLAMALCMVFALGFAFAETAETPAEKTYNQANHDEVCVAEGFEMERCNNPEHNYLPTCTEKGAECYLCKKCLKCVKKVEVDALGHDWVDVAEKAPTCTTFGWEAYAYCKSECCLSDKGAATVFAQKNDKGEYELIDGKPYIASLKHMKDGELFLVPARDDWKEYVATLACGQKVSLDAVCGYKDNCGATEPLIGKIDIELNHEWKPVDEIAALCETTGMQAHEVCVRLVNGEECGAVKFNGKIYEDLDDAKITTAGLKEAADRIVIDALGHDWKDVNGKAPTCTKPGYLAHVACARKDCGKIHGDKFVELEPVGHEFTVKLPGKAATCTEDGLEEAWKCAYCDQMAKKVVNGTIVTFVEIEERIVITKKNHINPNGTPAWKSARVTLATCTTDGEAPHRYCTLCGAIEYNGSIYAEEDGKKAVAVPAHGHSDEKGVMPNTEGSPERPANYDAPLYDEDMRALGLLPALTEGQVDEPKDYDPTCDTEGYVCNKWCAYCYELRTEAHYTDALGHIWELKTPGKMPGCESTGISDEWICVREFGEGENKTICGETDGREEIAALGHAYTFVEGKPATCTEEGWYGFEYCVRCNKGIVSTIDAGMMDGGDIEFVVTFDEDDELIIPDEVKVAPYWHMFEEGEDFDPATSVSPCVVTVEAVAPTCYENGIEGDGRWCELCQSYVVAPTVIVTKGHTWGPVVPAKEAKCLEDGHKAHQACEYKGVDGEPCLAYREVDKDGKPVDDKVYFGTKTEDGKGKNPPAELVLTLDHKEIPGIAIEPTCVKTGKTAGTYCEYCGMAMKAQEEVPALGHDWEVIAKVEPDCDDAGTKEYHLCKRCNAGEVVEDNGKVAHEFTYTVVEGEVVLDDVTEDKLVIPALGHVYNDYFAKEEPTCFGDGHEAGLRCSRCTPNYADGKNEAWLIYPSVINCKGHPAATTFKVEGIAPNCTEKGYHDFFYCTTCDHAWFAAECDICDVLDAEDVVDITMVFPFPVEYDEDDVVIIPELVKIDALGHDLASYVDRAPTCLDDGIMTDKDCQREGCDYKEPGELRPALGHSWEVVAKVEPTCEKEGKIEGVKCTVCGQMAELTKAAEYDYTDVKGNYVYVTEETRTLIPATGHDMQHVDRKAATCTEDGHEDGKICANGCGKKEGAETIKATGHNIEGVKWTVIKQPTTGIDGEGIRVKYCKVCNEVGAQELIPATSEGQLGDANLDGNVDLFDVVRIMNYALDPTIEIGDKGDYNGNGVIDIFDAIGLMNYLLG